KVEGCALRMDVSKNMTLASLKNFCRLGMIKLKRESEIANEFVRNLSIRTPSIQTLVEYLSGGNQQKVIIAKSLCCKSNIFLFDEPTQGIDVGAKVEIYNLLSELVKQGASIVIASSEMAELTGMCDRIITMYRGMIVGEFCRDHFDQEIILRYIFGKEREPCFERMAFEEESENGKEASARFD
ncbi:MAG: ATP-binding cassette domain-containing protein, partial [Candidatus Hodarchaeota archaeon]